MRQEDQARTVHPLGTGRNLRKAISTVARPRLEYEHQESLLITMQGAPPVRGIQSNGIHEQKEADKIEFKRFPNSNSFVIWKMNFKSVKCFPVQLNPQKQQYGSTK